MIYVALLRGINVGGHRKVPMAELRRLAGELGYDDARTYIQSGNLVFEADDGPDEVRRSLSSAIERRFGFPAEVAVRTEGEWRAIVESVPFPEAVAERPRFVHVGVPTAAPIAGAAERIAGYGRSDERVAATNGVLWIDFRAGVGKSKITSTAIDREAGTTVTLRNWRTVRAIEEMLA